jgi:NAD(P)-dependent dehydrogenase (short-subunit alcohol dehydrogenase family)
MSGGTLAGKVALVTGVSSGLGRAVAIAYVQAGAAVLGVARRRELGEELRAELDTDRFAFTAADISVVAECERAVATAISRFGTLDILVNNAAVRTSPPLLALHEVDERNWDAVCDTNLKGPFFLTKFALGPMRQRGGGVILNIASNTAEIALRQMAPYASAKAALVQLTRATAVEYFEDNIRANAILLGGTATGQQHRTAAAKQATPEERERASAVTAASWLYDPADVARTLVLLASDDAATITGASIAIDHATTAGGWASQWVHQMIARPSAAGLADRFPPAPRPEPFRVLGRHVRIRLVQVGRAQRAAVGQVRQVRCRVVAPHPAPDLGGRPAPGEAAEELEPVGDQDRVARGRRGLVAPLLAGQAERGSVGGAQPRGELLREQLDRDRHRVVGAGSGAVQRPAQVVLVRNQVDEQPAGSRIVAHERGDAGGPRVPGREQFGVRPRVRRTTAVGCPVRRVDVAIERVGRGGDEPAQHITHGQARHGRHRPGHVGRRAPREQPADTLPGSEPDLPVVAADLSADNHATNLAIGWLAGQLRPGALLVSLFYYTEVI